MKKKVLLPLVFAAAAVAVPARAADFDMRAFHDFAPPPSATNGLFGQQPGDSDSRYAPKKESCPLNERMSADLGDGWSVGLGGGIGNPKVSLTWRMTLHPERARGAAPKNCALIDFKP